MNILNNNGLNYISIDPIIDIVSGITATRLYISSTFDNFTDKAVFNYWLNDENDNCYKHSQLIIDKDDYKNWDGSINNVINFISQYLNIKL